MTIDIDTARLHQSATGSVAGSGARPAPPRRVSTRRTGVVAGALVVAASLAVTLVPIASSGEGDGATSRERVLSQRAEADAAERQAHLQGQAATSMASARTRELARRAEADAAERQAHLEGQ